MSNLTQDGSDREDPDQFFNTIFETKKYHIDPLLKEGYKIYNSIFKTTSKIFEDYKRAWEEMKKNDSKTKKEPIVLWIMEYVFGNEEQARKSPFINERSTGVLFFVFFLLTVSTVIILLQSVYTMKMPKTTHSLVLFVFSFIFTVIGKLTLKIQEYYKINAVASLYLLGDVHPYVIYSCFFVSTSMYFILLLIELQEKPESELLPQNHGIKAHVQRIHYSAKFSTPGPANLHNR